MLAEIEEIIAFKQASGPDAAERREVMKETWMKR
jgi:hypothetical protein